MSDGVKFGAGIHAMSESRFLKVFREGIPSTLCRKQILHEIMILIFNCHVHPINGFLVQCLPPLQILCICWWTPRSNPIQIHPQEEHSHLLLPQKPISIVEFRNLVEAIRLSHIERVRVRTRMRKKIEKGFVCVEKLGKVRAHNLSKWKPRRNGANARRGNEEC